MRLLLFLLAALVAAPCWSQPAIDPSDRIRLAEAFRVADAVGESIWPGWDDVPFAVLLVTSDYEYLVRHPNPSVDFRLLTPYDSLLQSPVYVRDQQLPTNFLAAFPAVSGRSTVVVGRPEATGKSSTFWVLSLLHEHFHQLQTTQAGYYAGVAGLDLSGGDETGMWMLNYPYPYEHPDVASAYQVYGGALLESMRQPDLEKLTEAHGQLRAVTSDADARYADFQLWQEGAARYTEYAVASALKGHPLEAFAALPDYIPYSEAAASVRRGVEQVLVDVDLPTRKREAYYALGAAEAMVLDAIRPGWRGRYLAHPFRIETFDFER